MSIQIETIPYSKMRYPTVGDWQLIGDNLKITVANLGNRDFNFLIGLHELIEAVLCMRNGISGKVVDEFDFKFEEEREQGLHEENDEPGDSPDAPYHKEHLMATIIEELIARELKIDWKEYEKAIYGLQQ